MRSRTTALVALLLLGGCSTGQEPAVQEAAREWNESVSAGDWDSACAMLSTRTREELERSERTPCPQALAAESPPAESGDGHVRVYGKQAQVSYDEGALFLSRFGSSWLVWAASCTPPSRDDRLPHDCQISGG